MSKLFDTLVSLLQEETRKTGETGKRLEPGSARKALREALGYRPEFMDMNLPSLMSDTHGKRALERAQIITLRDFFEYSKNNSPYAIPGIGDRYLGQLMSALEDKGVFLKLLYDNY